MAKTSQDKKGGAVASLATLRSWGVFVRSLYLQRSPRAPHPLLPITCVRLLVNLEMWTHISSDDAKP